MPLSDLYEAQAREAARAVGRDGPALDSDEEEEKEQAQELHADEEMPDAASEAAGGANSTSTEQTREAHGPYCIEEGWELVAVPDTQEGQLQLFKPKWRHWWKNKRIAHIFDDGWFTGTSRDKQLLEGKVHWVFYYHAMGRTTYVHSLLPEEHGLTNSWVVIAKSKK